MQVIFFSSNMDIVDEWKIKYNLKYSSTCYDVKSLDEKIQLDSKYIIIADFDSISNELNKLIASDTIPKNMIVLEKAPEITTGKMLISHGIKAYGNSRMQDIHFTQMFQAVLDDKIWTYPKLTVALTKNINTPKLNEDAINLIQNRLTPKEIEVIYLILDGFINDIIASKLNITTRTVKAHISSIFSKLHVSDRISLILLLK